jgi:hypothetical protein
MRLPRLRRPGYGGHWFMIASFEFGRTQVTERRVPPLAIVKVLDVFEDFTAGLSSGVPTDFGKPVRS